ARLVAGRRKSFFGMYQESGNDVGNSDSFAWRWRFRGPADEFGYQLLVCGLRFRRAVDADIVVFTFNANASLTGLVLDDLGEAHACGPPGCNRGRVGLPSFAAN